MPISNEDGGMILKLSEQATLDIVITCPECYTNIEPDSEQCHCGYENLLRKHGFT